jgi:ribosomal protein S18 acetylase RimI-like enzyme
MPVSELEESLFQFLAFRSAFARLQPAGQVVELEGLSLLCAATSWPTLNSAFFTRPVEEDAEWTKRLRTASEFYAGRQCRWNVIVCEDWLSGAGRAALAEHRLKPSPVVIGMKAERLLPPTRSLPPLSCRQIVDAEGRYALVDINSISYGVPLAWGREVAQNPALWSGRELAHVGYVGDQPVTGCASARLDDVLYVGWVATLPEYRHRGYGEAVMRQNLAESRCRHGLERTALHATEAGLPMYRAMGYREVARFASFG